MSEQPRSPRKPTVPKTPPSKDRTHSQSQSKSQLHPEFQTQPHPRPTHSRHQSQPKLTPPPATQTQTQTQTQRPQHHRHQSQTQAAHAYDYNYNHNHEPDSPHFSPSKARAAAQQSQRLATLKRWLFSLEPEQHPSSTSTSTSSSTQGHTQLQRLLSKFESEYRLLGTTNPALASSMVAWLEEAMYVNRAADERGRLLHEAREAEVELGVAEASGRDGEAWELVEELQSMLSERGRGAIDSLAETAVLLGFVPSVDGSVSLDGEMGQAVVDYTIHSQDVEQQVGKLESLQKMLTRQLEEVKRQLTALEEDRRTAGREAEYMHPQTAQWNRETKQIAMKIQEYNDRVVNLERSRPVAESGRGKNDGAVLIEDVIEMQDRVDERRRTVTELEGMVRSLGGLPPDLEASREEVRRARTELEHLKARREELFSILAEQ